ncbi:glycosyltransferase [Cyanobacterium aponinum UTEX 3222]|uniref:Glycosyl transferase group 1 n=3 Tax=Cyanobacterium aponinum TaxID=379064 RepID=K9Z6P5_CYAAP|nr:glycosyltransferase [Cyanobacterium aponinum]RMD72687.1 MAG: glycosyltransferase family 4 protein [Cyanobacteria bacterium J149]WRL43214.1 glycosyltransferase [Cyanobacterium aponinum UTEX 3222]AFZ54804.1 glycosyl transferase group 1 [Cyanobacterium aponinum PCC 10605]MTF38245.1 glycosyltransferase [Cyanobacterium aponinum 0216]PHV64067.1 glycosyltransferase family 4 protein [Cyanobacterium aponinum IPPAS B-1201]
MKIALVHEWLTPKATGGSELVVKEILQFIDAQVFALIDFESVNPHSYLYQREIKTTFLQHFPFSGNGVQKYLPLLPLAIEQLNLTEYDVVLSSSHAVAKGVITRPDQPHICYCHTPMRYAWDLTFDYLDRTPAGKGIQGIFTRYLLHQLRQWDVISANRVDFFIANSHHTARRIWRCYRRQAKVIYPPVQVSQFPFKAEKSDYYLTVSRLVSYKKVSMIVEAFNRNGLPLVVIGEGAEMDYIRAIAKPNITLLGSVNDKTLKEYMSNAKAFIYAACEDFGIAIVEAQACGTPVIAYGGGGALETVIDMRENSQQGTGILFSPQTVEGLLEGVKTFTILEKEFKPENARIQAEKFSAETFKQDYLAFFDQCCQNFALIRFKN